jgi:hypothetical protein
MAHPDRLASATSYGAKQSYPLPRHRLHNTTLLVLGLFQQLACSFSAALPLNKRLGSINIKFGCDLLTLGAVLLLRVMRLKQSTS